MLLAARMSLEFYTAFLQELCIVPCTNVRTKLSPVWLRQGTDRPNVMTMHKNKLKEHTLDQGPRR